MIKACYRELLNYKYQLMDDFALQIDIKPQREIDDLIKVFVINLGGP